MRLSCSTTFVSIQSCLKLSLDTRLEVKEFIVMAVANMCMQKAKNLKSGWSIVVNIFTLAA